MKALQFQGIGKLSLVETEIPRPGPDELLIRTGAAVICTSDVNELRSGIFGATLPIIFGHEGSGTVAAVGSAVKGFSVGDAVATHPVHPCGGCANCKSGIAHLCANMRHFGLNMPGTFAEYYLVGASRARRVVGGATFAATALAEPVAVCLQAIHQARVGRSSQLLIVGDGPFGILMSILARKMAIGQIVLAGEHRFRLGFSAAHESINVREQPLESFHPTPGNAFQGGSFDAAILAVASADAMKQAIPLLRSKGRLVVFSAFNDLVPVDLLSVHLRELEIVGACNDEDRFGEAVQRIVEMPDVIERLITHRFPLEQYEQAFALAATGHDRALKVAFTFETP